MISKTGTPIFQTPITSTPGVKPNYTVKPAAESPVSLPSDQVAIQTQFPFSPLKPEISEQLELPLPQPEAEPTPTPVKTPQTSNPVVLTCENFSWDGKATKYLEEVSFLNDRYAGVVDKLAAAESKAEQLGYDEMSAMGLHSKLMQDPPWPAGSTPDMFGKITAKAKELAQAHPNLACTTGDKYDFSKAQERVEDLYDTLHTLVDKDNFPDAAIAARAKQADSLKTKMAGRNEKKPDSFTLAHLTDTVGARVDVANLQQLGSAAKKIEEHYGDQLVGRLDYVSDPGANGYRAIHYIVDLGDRMAEIQVSTHQLRAADLATHDTVYKPLVPIPKEAVDRLSTAADRIMFVETMNHFGMSD